MAYQCCVVLCNVLLKKNWKSLSVTGTQKVSVLIPARNEEAVISHILDDIVRQSYPYIEVFVYDDCSTDDTAKIVNSYVRRYSYIHLISGEDLPRGWVGKNFACYNLAKQALGDVYLFLDADVRIAPGFIQKMLAYYEKNPADLISVFPRQIMCTKGERMVVPIMNYVLVSLLPLYIVRKSGFSSVSAANGQCMFFEAQKYILEQPHKVWKQSRVEDINIAKYYKQKSYTVDCLASIPDISCRMYSGGKEALIGFSKNYLAFFGNSYIWAIVFWMLTIVGSVPVLLLEPFPVFLLYVCCGIALKIGVAYVSNQSVMVHIRYAFFHHCIMGILICLSVWFTCNKKLVWKGRNI
ncbi:MAG: glycosyltransferase family A protein [Bacteroidales bacterium]